MTAAGIIVALLGVGGLIWGIVSRLRAGRLAKTPLVSTADAANRGSQVAGEKGAISVQGAVRCDQPLQSPVTGTPCLYYELEVTGSWKDGDSTRTEKYVDEKQSAMFGIDDGSGPVQIMAHEGGDFPLDTKFNQSRKEGAFADLKSAFGKGEPMVFGNYAFQNPGDRANEFRCVEKVLPLQQNLFAAGRTEGNVIAAPKWASLILSPKTRDQLLGASQKHSKYGFIGGGASLGLGTILTIIGIILSPAEADEPTEPPSFAAAPAAVEEEAPPAIDLTVREPAEVTVTQIGRRTDDPLMLDGIMTTNLEAKHIAPGCAGYVSLIPPHSIVLPRKQRRLALRAVGDADGLGLLIRHPDGESECVDGNNVELSDVRGAVTIYVRTAEPESSTSYTLGVARKAAMNDNDLR